MLHSFPLPEDPSDRQAPPAFTYPFHYEPHPLARAAATDLQRHLVEQRDWSYDFGLDHPDDPGGQGKMFGVLVVETTPGEYRYLAAYSGKLAESNHLPGFVPPVYDVLDEDGFYKAGEREVNSLSAQIERLENSSRLAAAIQAKKAAEAQASSEIAAQKKARKQAKAVRDARRHAAADLPEQELKALEEELVRESVSLHFALKDNMRVWEERIKRLTTDLGRLEEEISELRQARKNKSNDLQAKIFQQYRFLDANGETNDLLDIFARTVRVIPPAGAGECAAPKLLQYAYLHGLKPVVMAEFWWGQSPKSEVRKHGRFYPACRGKCEPILGHMLQGLTVDPNPMLSNPAEGKQLPIIYEDEDLLIVNKPAGFLSVPGRLIEDSVQTRMEARYPGARNHLIVHRLDMSTSGLLLLTKRKEIHKKLQQQFFKRTIKKRYVALVEGAVHGEAGFIDLPLVGNFDDRPRQMVDYQNGKTARTKWKLLERLPEELSRVNLWPVTGRTHQLRVHCAHPLGLNASIVGDELYGILGGRLCLHAEYLAFLHPGTQEPMEFYVEAEF